MFDPFQEPSLKFFECLEQSYFVSNVFTVLPYQKCIQYPKVPRLPVRRRPLICKTCKTCKSDPEDIEPLYISVYI